MTLRDAIVLLDTAPHSEELSRLNQNLTEAQAVKIVRDAVATFGCPKGSSLGLDDPIHPLMEKRVRQVSLNQKRPRY